MKGDLVFIGAGNMAEALLQGVLRGGRWPKARLVLTDIAAERRAYMARTFGVRVLADNAAAVCGAQLVVLAVKPQVLLAVLADLRPALPPDALVLSIAAGVPTAKIEAALGGVARVVRAMPNAPALVGCGAAAICAGRHAAARDLGAAEQVLGAAGLVVRVPEQDMDAVTALSGSGPAYVFYLMEAMLEAARRMGLAEATAQQLVYATVKGSAELIMQDGLPPQELRRRVTSAGGTTAAAIAVTDRRQVMAALVEAILAAQRRAGELARG
ncbi:MAG: pyrroline-5-carboxylate reductase [Kiritimatiellaeota bacterium]|nr:pyrroline-5-carboxylate reductase [Kiritimatiellota bacterium]